MDYNIPKQMEHFHRSSSLCIVATVMFPKMFIDIMIKTFLIISAGEPSCPIFEILGLTYYDLNWKQLLQ